MDVLHPDEWRFLDEELEDGTVEVDVLVTGERSFPGLAFRHDGTTWESFFVRPHQRGNDDAVQYTPCFNGVSSWQLYHGDGFWAPVELPIGEPFTIRVVFAGARAEMYVGDLETPVLVARLRVPPRRGRVAVHAGGQALRLGRFEATPATEFRREARPVDDPMPGAIRSWEVLGPNGWSALEAEPNGLLDLARVAGLGENGNEARVRAVLHADEPHTRLLELGFSDRVLVRLNGVPLYRGDDSYRSRDYRFLGSVGWYDGVYLRLEAGANELELEVGEDFGGWGLQARLASGGA